MNDHKIVLSALDRTVELMVLLTAVYFDTGHDVPVRVDDRDIWELRGDVFAALVELSLDVLILGAPDARDAVADEGAQDVRCVGGMLGGVLHEPFQNEDAVELAESEVCSLQLGV